MPPPPLRVLAPPPRLKLDDCMLDVPRLMSRCVAPPPPTP